MNLSFSLKKFFALVNRKPVGASAAGVVLPVEFHVFHPSFERAA